MTSAQYNQPSRTRLNLVTPEKFVKGPNRFLFFYQDDLLIIFFISFPIEISLLCMFFRWNNVHNVRYQSFGKAHLIC